MKNFLKHPVILDSHNTSVVPIGKFDIQKGEIVFEPSLIERGFLLDFGILELKSHLNDKGEKVIDEAELIEISALIGRGCIHEEDKEISLPNDIFLLCKRCKRFYEKEPKKEIVTNSNKEEGKC